MRSATGAVGGMAQKKGSRQRCSSWTVLHAQCTSALLSSGFPISQGNAEALDSWGGKANDRMIPYFLSNISAKNYRNRIVYVKITASRRWDVFWDTVNMNILITTKIVWSVLEYSVTWWSYKLRKTVPNINTIGWITRKSLVCNSVTCLYDDVVKWRRPQERQ